MMTFKELERLPFRAIISWGKAKNEPNDIYMTDSDIGRELLWIAKKGGVHDFAIYCDWFDKYENLGFSAALAEVAKYGQKISNLTHIQKLVPCDQDCINAYRF